MPHEGFILASASPRRRAILSEMGLRFRVLPCALAEPTERPAGVAPAAWAEALAHFKARAVADEHEGEWVLGADTVVWCGGELLGKPRDPDDARRMLRKQAERASDVITGVCVCRAGRSAWRCISHAVTKVWMRDCPEQLDAYLDSGDWRGKAGAYGIQTVGDRLVRRIDGSFSNVVGLPRELVERVLGVAANL